MRAIGRNKFDPHEEELIKILIKIGLSKNVAKVLVYLIIVKEATSRDIEIAADLWQPEVSVAMRTLMEYKWIEHHETRREGKGRPVRIYRLDRPAHEIIDQIEREKSNDIETQSNLIDRLREISATL